MIFSESPKRKQINDQVSWGHWFTFANILLAIMIASVYVIASPAPSSAISVFYLFITWFGHVSFVIFFGFVIFLLPLCYKIMNQKVLKITGSIIAAMALAILAFDALLYTKTGFHISLSSAELLKNETQGQISAFNWLQWFYLGLMFIVWFMFQLVIANSIFRNLKKFQKIHIGKYVTSIFVSCFIASHGIHVWADAKLYSPVLQQDNMFPLSYPATAKTLMSRAGLLDLKDYKQKQNLQFNDSVFNITYPPEQMYCSVDNTKKVIFLRLLSEEKLDSSLLQQAQLNDTGYHFISDSLNNDYLDSVLYSMPQVFLSSINQEMPISLALLKAFDVNIQIFDDSIQNKNSIYKDFRSESFEKFLDQITNSSSGFYVGLVTADQIDSVALDTLTLNAKVILLSHDQTGHYPKLYTNIDAKVNMSSSEDIIPTLLTEMGCAAEPNQYSIGQSIQRPSRNWSVSTQGQHLVVIQNDLITEVSGDGSFEIRNMITNERLLTEIDTNLLSRSIKHLQRFTED